MEAHGRPNGRRATVCRTTDGEAYHVRNCAISWPTLRAALLLLRLSMTRPGNVRHMRKSEIDAKPFSRWESRMSA